MSTEKEKDRKKQEAEEKSKLDKQLNQTFPASDPPSHTRPGSKRDKDDKKK